MAIRPTRMIADGGSKPASKPTLSNTQEALQRLAPSTGASALPAAAKSSKKEPKTVASVAPGTRSQTVNVPKTPTSTEATVVSRTDRYGRNVQVFATGPNAGTIVGSGGILYEPPVEAANVPAPEQPTQRMPKGIAGMDIVQSETGTYSYKPKENPEDAVYKIALQKLSEYNLAGIAESLRRARNQYPEVEISDLLFIVENDERYNQPFKDRFKANELRVKQGLPKLTSSAYLTLERDFARLFTTYNLPMFKNQQQYDKLIAGDVDIADATSRVTMAYDRVLTDTSTRNAFRQFYGSLTDADIVSALLSPEQQIPALERKVIAAEVGGQALRQGLAAGVQSIEAMMTDQGKQVSGYSNVQRGTLGSEALAGEGVDEAAAASGYERIAAQLPEAEKLSAIYGGRAAQVSQKELEQAELLGLESAKRKRAKLVGMEEAQFAGEAGTMRTSLGRRGRSGAF
jgi:hypothetical protein